MKRILAVLLLLAVALLAFGCQNGKDKPGATPTPRPIPPAVTIRPEPQGIGLEDPAFEALPGAKAYFGHLGGTVFRIEIPDEWNGRLLLYMHGFQGLAPEAEVQDPAIRNYLIRNGWAWGASSYSSTSLIPGRAADETAALWDYFVEHYGQPVRTFVTGHSMGGAATNIAAERYGNRFDGALQLCGFAGQSAITEIIGDFFFAGAYIAGVTQAEFDAAIAPAETPGAGEVPPESAFSDNPLNRLVETKIKPALQDPALQTEFENIMLDLTGGPRAFDHEGFALEEPTMWERAELLVSLGLAHNEDRQYALGPLSETSNDELNAGVVRRRLNTDAAFVNAYLEGSELTGDVQMPLLTMQTTGDWQVPLDQQGILRRMIEAAGKADMLVQRAVREAGHCAFTNAEWQQGLEDLVNWVENGKKPRGEDFLVDDLTKLGDKYTLAPRFGSAEAEDVSGADERITMTGTVTFDGAPLGDGSAYPVVRTAGRDRPSCSFEGFSPVTDGHYEVVIAGDGEAAGCGVSGADVYLRVYVPALDEVLTSQQTVPWPEDGKTLTFDATVSGDSAGVDLDGSTFAGAVLDASGDPMPPGTIIEAYGGETLCGVSSLPPVVMGFSDPSSYIMWLTADGCADGGTVSFKIDGETAAQTATNDFSAGYEILDLSLP